ATPRRLALMVEDIPERSPEIAEERKGPRVNAPEAAIQGFLKSAGLASIKHAQIVKDPKKGDFYLARSTTPGRASAEIVASLVPAVAAKFPWPKSMRWGSGKTTWGRPLVSIPCPLHRPAVPFHIPPIHTPPHPP